jgi:hypothetical protein
VVLCVPVGYRRGKNRTGCSPELVCTVKYFFRNPKDNLGGIVFPVGFNNGTKKQIISFDMILFLIQSLILIKQRRV